MGLAPGSTAAALWDLMQPRLRSPLLRAADAPRAHSEVGRLERLVISALITHLELQELAAATGAATLAASSAAAGAAAGGATAGGAAAGEPVQLPASLTAVWEAARKVPLLALTLTLTLTVTVALTLTLTLTPTLTL